MHPKLKAGLNLAQKRKLHLANEPAKRPKTDDSSARPMTPKNSTVTTSPGMPKKTIINLAAKATSLPDEAYFHPTAAKLFDQTIEEFRQAAKVFWISSSANVRAVSREQSDQILAKLSHNKTVNWSESSQYTTIWNEQRLAVVNHFVEKIRYYTDEFLQTEGGIRFKETVYKSRKRKTTLPVLDCDTLCNFEGAVGLQWSYTTVFDIFSLLDEVHDGENQIDVETESGVEKENWFTSDSLKTPGSWYERLSRVASALVIQWTLILCGFSRPGGQSVEASDKSLILLLEHISFSPVSNKYPPFPIADMPLRTWLLYGNEEESIERYPSQRSQKDLTGLVDPPEPISNVWPPAPSYPPAPVNYPPLSRTDHAFLLGTPRQKMYLVQAIAEQQINAMANLVDLMDDEIQTWQKDLEMLIEQDHLLSNLTFTGRAHATLLKDTAKKSDALTTRIED